LSPQIMMLLRTILVVLVHMVDLKAAHLTILVNLVHTVVLMADLFHPIILADLFHPIILVVLARMVDLKVVLHHNNILI
jgi:hypothetical protein